MDCKIFRILYFETRKRSIISTFPVCMTVPLTWEPDIRFSQNFKGQYGTSKKIYTSMDFCKIQKTLFSGYFWALSSKWDFSQKSSSASFLPLRHPNFMRSFRKILPAFLEKKRLRSDIIKMTYLQWWNHRIPFCLNLGLQKLHWFMTKGFQTTFLPSLTVYKK